MKPLNPVLKLVARMAVHSALHSDDEGFTEDGYARLEPNPAAVSSDAAVQTGDPSADANSLPDSSACDATSLEGILPDLLRTEPSATTQLASAPKRFIRRSADEVICAQTTTWAVHNLLPTKGVVSFYGATGSGKSLLCLHLADMLSRGLPWFGHIVPQKLKVVYVVLEGQGGMPARLRALKESIGQGVSKNLTLITELVIISSEKDVVEFVDSLKQSGGADVVIIDTLNRASPGADENRSSDMGRILFGASYIQEKTNSLVILVHHSGKDESRGMRGHSSAASAMEVIIEVKRDGSGKRWWRLEKSKDGEDGISHAFELKVVDLGVDDFGLPLSSVTIQELDGAGPSKQRQASLGKNQMAVMAQFKILIAENALAEPPVNGISFDESLRCLKDCIDVADVRHRAERVKDALNSLIKSGYILESEGLLTLPP